MKTDPLNALNSLGALDALSATGFTSQMREMDAFQNEARRLARQHEELLEAAGRPRWLRELEERETTRFMDLTAGFNASNLAAHIGGTQDLSSMASTFAGADALKAAGTAAYAQELRTLQEQANRILCQGETVDAFLGQTRWQRDIQDQQNRVEELVRGISVSDAALNAGVGFEASRFSKISTAYDAILASVAGSLVGLAQSTALVDALGFGTRVAASHGFDALRDQVAAYIQAPLPDFAGTELMKGVAERLNIGNSSAFVDLMADALGGVDAASFGTAALDFGARLYEKRPELRNARTTEDLRATLEGLDANALLAQMARLTAAIEQSNAAQAHRNGVEARRFAITVLLALVAIFVAILDLEKEEHVPALKPGPAPLPSPHQKHRSAPRPALVAKSRVAVRVGPHTTQRVALFVDEGQILPVLDTRAGWARVRYVAPESQGVSITGWVQVKYTSPMDVETLRMLVCDLTAAESVEVDCPD